MARKVELLAQVKDSCEALYTSDCQRFLDSFMAPLCTTLDEVAPQFSDTAEHKLRSASLEVLSRLRMDDTLRRYVPNMLKSLLKVSITIAILPPITTHA